MASLKDIKGRINSVKSTQKITNAMKLVSAAKFARASHAIQSARPYGAAFSKMVSNLLESSGSEISSPLLRTSEEKKVLLVVVATDRGLCGGLNTNVFKQASLWIREKKAQGVQIEAIAWGRRAGLYVSKEKLSIVDRKERVLESPSYKFARDAAEELIGWFTAERYDAVYFAYPKYQSALAQIPTVTKTLPVSVDEVNQAKEAQANDFIVEPALDQMVDMLLTRKVINAIYQMLLESAASEHGARMSAMDSATNNAKEVIKKLTLTYNRARQAAITKELIEIISGAEALH